MNVSASESAAPRRASEEQYRALFDAIDEGFCILEMIFDSEGVPVDYRFLEVNPAFEEQTGLVGAEGRRIREMVPDLEAHWFERYGRIALTGNAERFVSGSEVMGRWFDVYAFRLGGAESRKVVLVFKDVSERKRIEDALAASEAQSRSILESITDGFFALDANWRFTYLNRHAETILGRTSANLLDKVIWDEYPGLAESEFDGLYRQALERGIAGSLTAYYPDHHRWYEVHAYPAPQGMTAYFRNVTEQREQEAERARLLAESQAQAKRERLINQVGQAVRDPNLTPDEVQVRAAALLGQALGLDRCYFSVYDPARNTLTIGGDWRRPDLPPIAGKRPGTDYAQMSAEFYPDTATSAAYRDIHEAPLSPANQKRFADLGFRSVVGVAYREGQSNTITAAMGAVMVDGPRDWTRAEVEVLEAAATLVWTTLQAIRRQQRERHIASQLQDALIPSRPPSLPNLDLAAYYQPALDEAGVGGDFFDVFAVEKGCTALVVADLSGKGLAAARQVATVRNMLRFALYNAPSVADALTQLNHTLVEHDLLTGFATVFVGMYDQGARTLTYVNCGQEPGLLWRRETGQTEELLPTGPVLGGFDTSPFRQQSVLLASGDVLALFTDGLTEVGPTRRRQLEASGVAALLQTCSADGPCTAQEMADRLIAGINEYARGGTRDDVALLVGVVA